MFLGVYLYIFGFSLLVDPDFNHDLGNPTAWQRWYVGETQFNITLIEILKKPDRAVLGYQNNTYIVEQFEKINLGNHSLKMAIYPNRGYVWPKWDVN